MACADCKQIVEKLDARIIQDDRTGDTILLCPDCYLARLKSAKATMPRPPNELRKPGRNEP